MANNVATPLERQFMQIPGLELVTSNNGQGHSSFVLQFDLSKSLDGAATDVQAAITRAQGQLPVDLPSPPTFTKTNPERPADHVHRAGQRHRDRRPALRLRQYAGRRAHQHSAGREPGGVYGTQSAVRIKADPSAMAIRNITLEDLTSAIKNGTAYTGRRPVRRTASHLPAAAAGATHHRRTIQRLIVGQSNGAPVYLKDVAPPNSVQDERIDMRFWVRGYPQPGATVVVGVYSGGRASNAVEVAKSVRDLLPNIQSQLPSSVLVVPIYDRSETIVGSIKDVQATLYIAFVLVVMVIFAFLGRATDTLIPAVALPLSLLLTFIVDERSWLQPRQSLADGADARHRFPS
jgi:hydrophobic/amphiphilic exporter-1 (mainly G- bacteria), HAE1 family